MQAVQQRRSEVGNGQKTSSNKRAGAGVRRKGNPGTRGAGKNIPPKSDAHKASAIPGGDPFTISQLDDAEPSLSVDDQDRLAIVRQIQEQISKMGEEATGSLEEAIEIERLLHGYVSMCHNAAMEFMRANQSRASGRVLRQCEEFCQRTSPSRVSQIVVQKGIMHTIYNNLAQHSNMIADMNTSIGYLEKALEAAENPDTDQDLLPLAETYLNLANGYSFLSKYDSALKFAEKALKFAKYRCNRLREEIQEERSKGPDGPNPKVDSLDFQLNDFIAIKIMAHLCVGEQHERLGSFNAAIKFFSEGKQFAETNFGTKHPLYTKCINAMGGARLKSKYQTKEVYRSVNNGSTAAKPEKQKKLKKRISSKDSRNSRESLHEHNTIKSKLMARRMQGNGSSHQSRRDITGAVHKAEVRMSNMMRNHQDNLLLANCDTWTSMHCRHPRPKKRESLMVSIEKQKRRSNRMRPGSAMSERKMSRQDKLTHDILDNMTDNKRAPYKVVCKIGPTCKNHNWSQKSPLKKVCTRGLNCPNHDWDCSMRSSRSFRSSIKSTRSVQPQAQVQEVVNLPEIQVQAPIEPKLSQSVIEVTDTHSNGNHSCMLEQTERIHQQQMSHMRTMQEDQFKMLQLVMEGSQNNQSTTSQQQQQMAYMYYPHQQQQQMYNYGQGYYQPQFYNQGGHGGYQHPMYHGYQHQNGQSQSEADESQTETELSDAEQIKAGKKPDQSEISKAEMLEQAYQKQQEEMLEMQKQMSTMQMHYNEQINQMRQSQEAFKIQAQAKSERVHSPHSEKRPISKKDFREDSHADSEINERVDEALFGASNTEKKQTVERTVMRDASAQAFESQKNQGSILKQSTTKFKGVGYHSTLIDNSIQRDNSDTKSDHFRLQQSPSQRNQSFKSRASSFHSNKSFRIPQGRFAMTKNDAATIIQKSYKGYRAKEDYRLMKRNRGIQKKFLFRATVRSSVAQIITCSVNITRTRKPDSLSFIIAQARRPTANQMFDIDLRRFSIHETTDMKDKVMRIIRDSLAAEDIHTAIGEAFETEVARQIIEAEFFSSDDYENADFGKGRLRHHASASSMQEISEEEVVQHQPQPIVQNQESYVNVKQSSAADKRSQIDAEIERIRKKCDLKYHVNVDQVLVKGHKRKFDDYQAEDDLDEELHRHVKCDSEDESREIVISQVAIRRGAHGAGAEETDSCCESQHNYEFTVGDKRQPHLVRKLNLFQVIKIQSLVRGFLARSQTKTQKKVLIHKVLKLDEQLMRFTLVKNRRLDYTLSAIGTMNRKLMKSKQLLELPFEDDETCEKFEQSLLFSCNGNEISELDLIGKEKPQNPFVEADSHLFITDYEELNKKGDIMVYSWKLREQYPCEFWQIRSVQDGTEQLSYKVVVNHQNMRHYIKLHKLPAEMFYMAYYLNETLQLQFNESNQFQYIFMNQIVSKRQFKQRMEDTEIRFFGATRSHYTSTNRTIDYTRKTPIDTRKFETLAPKANEFTVERHGCTYIAEIFDERQDKCRYSIVVKRKDDPTDKDWISMTQITPFMDELIGYLKDNLRIYTKQNGRIDYLALANDYKIFSAQNKRRVRESMSAHRGDFSQRDSSLSGNASVRQSLESGHSAIRVVPKLAAKLDEFEIVQNQATYRVNVQERRNYEGRPLQITVTSTKNEKDSKYMVYRASQLQGEELKTYLIENLLVYCKFDEESQDQVIDFVALTKGGDAFRRSATMSLSTEFKTSKKNIVKSRSKGKQMHTNEDMNIRSELGSPQNLTMSREIYSPKMSSNWTELAKQTFWTGSKQLDAVLMAKNPSSSRKTRAPIPKGPQDTEFYKIMLVDQSNQVQVSELQLSVQACSRLLNVQKHELQSSVTSTTLQELMQGGAIYYDQTQTDLLKQSCSYQRNKSRYDHILMGIVYDESAGQVKFDVDQICSISQIPANEWQSSPRKPKTISIQSKLTSNRKQQAARTGQDFQINSDHNSKLDGGAEGDLSDTLKSGDSNIPVTKYKIQKRSEMKRAEYARQESTVSSNQGNESDFPAEGQVQTAKKASSIIKTSQGQFLNVSVAFDGQNYHLTVNDRIKRSNQLCENMLLTSSFIAGVDQEGLDKITAVKKAVERKLKNANEICNLDGSIDATLFNN